MNKSAILLMNLGSPDSPTTRDLKPYLREFLMDERVIDLPFLLRSLIVKGIIVPFRSPKSAEKYRSIWTKDGSPLVIHTQKLTALVGQKFSEPVYYGMRYGNPTTVSVLKRIHAENPGLEELILFPLYPHYAMSSYETAVVQVKELHADGKYASELKIVPPFFDDTDYIHALAESIKPYMNPETDHYLFSYHGVPERHIKKTDFTGKHCLQVKDCCNVPSGTHAVCYRHQVITTTELTTKKLGIPAGKFSFSFQSRLGQDAWLKPYTAGELKEFPSRGIKNLVVVCPAFISDCLETLEEIEKEGEEIFLENGGQTFKMVPALNEGLLWVDTMEKYIRRLMESKVVGEK